MLDLSKQSDREDKQWAIKCQHCGKFISRKQIEDKQAKFHFIPDSQFGPEESYWEHIKC